MLGPALILPVPFLLANIGLPRHLLCHDRYLVRGRSSQRERRADSLGRDEPSC
jgi:hypothetical protein